ncbi:hypothetical protein RB653_005096 [Dictyostelium firmibasis]|uniref:Uncharacterized protein n=1 Tax=Dictyostelium firmibasis TaxID=79012 RepID=A0AAN7UBR7_9MYCE
MDKINKNETNSDSEEEIGLGGSLIVEELETYKYEFYDDIKIEIEGQELQNVNIQPSTGLLPWPASRVLSLYISKYKEEFIGKDVVELGSGVGLCGLVSSKYTNFTLFTDGDEKSLPLLRDNVQSNSNLFNNKINNNNNSNNNNDRISIERLYWGNNQPTLDSFKEKYSNKYNFDIVIGSDLIYVDASIEPLFFTVDSILNTNKSGVGKGTFYLSFLDRKNHFPILKSVSEKYNFTMENIELNTFINYEASTMARMFIFKRNNK